jgi:alginate O-acetyltransferase complex protein AlgI
VVFNSFDFLIFFALVFSVQLALNRRYRNYFLLAASYFFYGCWDWRFLFLMLAATAVGYTAAQQIASREESKHRAFWLTVGVATNLLILGFFKYFHFFEDSIVTLLSNLGIPSSHVGLKIILPVGISFYTFQNISYIVDVYRREVKHLGSFSGFALYISFFPQLVAGPIERGTHLLPQIEEGRFTTLESFSHGCWLFLKGLFLKTVIADNLGPVADYYYSQPSPSTAQVLLGTYCFAFQIYGDFAGYTDMARGIGKMLGYDFMLNFRLPYFATSPSEFWQRWHISLSSWLRDYLYIPLGGNRGGAWSTYQNLMLTMVLGGLWHGAQWTFVVWGVFHGSLLIIQRLLPRQVSQPNANSLVWALQVLVMLHLTCIGWLIFRAESLEQLATLLKGLLYPHFHITQEDILNGWKLAMLCIPLVLFQLAQEKTKNLNLLIHFSPTTKAVFYAIITFLIITLGSFGDQKFIYFQF